MKNNTGEKSELRAALREATERKRNGMMCFCGRPIWAIGYAITGEAHCFSCTTGESNCSDDYEIDSVCF